MQDKLEEEDVNLLTAFPSGKILKLKGSIFLANADDIFKNLSKDFGGTDLEIRILDISEIGFLDHAGLDLVQKIIERFGISGVVADFAVFEKISKRVGVDLKQVRSG